MIYRYCEGEKMKPGLNWSWEPKKPYGAPATLRLYLFWTFRSVMHRIRLMLRLGYCGKDVVHTYVKHETCKA